MTPKLRIELDTGPLGKRTPNAPRVSVDEDSPRRLTLTVGEGAEALGISRAFAYESAASGDLPSIRIGRRILVPKAALEKMVNAY